MWDEYHIQFSYQEYIKDRTGSALTSQTVYQEIEEESLYSTPMMMRFAIFTIFVAVSILQQNVVANCADGTTLGRAAESCFAIYDYNPALPLDCTMSTSGMCLEPTAPLECTVIWRLVAVE